MSRHAGIGDLTQRQREVAALLARGFSNSEIAERLGISLDGAKWHVSELIGKLGVDSRDEVADAWEATRRGSRWAWAGAFAGLAPLKIGAGVLAAASVVTAGGVLLAASLGSSSADDDDPADALVLANTPTPTPMPTATPTLSLFPPAPGAVFSHQEALDTALREVERYLRRLDDDMATPLQPSGLVLEKVEWLPGITTFQSDDPDRYWDPGDGLVRDVWRFQWTAGVVRSSRPELGSGTVNVDALIEDGNPGEALAAQAIFTSDVNQHRVGGGGGWRSHEMTARIERMHTQTGPARKVAWLNGDQQIAHMELFPNADGNWCSRLVNAAGERIGGGHCLAPGIEPYQDLQVPLAFSYNPATATYGPAVLEIVCSTDTEVLVVARSDGEVLSFPLSDPIEDVPIPARFAYLDIGPMPESFTVTSYDANGVQIGETTLGRGGPPPPPPPGRPMTPTPSP